MPRLHLKDCATGKIFTLDVLDPDAPVSPKHPSINLMQEMVQVRRGNSRIYWRDPIDNRLYREVDTI